MTNTIITERGDITITERPAGNEREMTRLRLDASRQTDTGIAKVSLHVAMAGAGYKVVRCESKGRSWTRPKVAYHGTEAGAIAMARVAFEIQLRWLAGVVPTTGRPVDAVNL